MKNKVLVDMKQFSKQLDNVAKALDEPRRPGRIKQVRRRFAKLTECIRKDAIKRGSFQQQKNIF